MINKGNIRHTFNRLWMVKTWLLLALLVLLAMATAVEFLVSGLARRTFVFYTIDSGIKTVEERNMVRTSSQELNIIRYVEEALMGPMSPDSVPLFPRETRLHSLLYRNGVVYVDLSEDAALPLSEGGEVFTGIKTLSSGIQRNFSSVRDVRFFIAGKAARRLN